MKVGQKIKRDGIIYEIYKIDKFGRCYAEDEYHINLICVPNLQRIK